MKIKVYVDIFSVQVFEINVKDNSEVEQAIKKELAEEFNDLSGIDIEGIENNAVNVRLQI